MTKHTPTPWSVRGPFIYESSPYSPDLRHVAQCSHYDGIGLSTSSANATFIVRACNAHDALVEALEKIYRYSTGKAGGTHGRILEIADAALKLAKGE